jgi:hypothetical protein
LNISPKFSQADLAGVVGLLAFLADKKGCEARLEELDAAARKAYDAESLVQARINEAADAERTIANLREVTEQERKRFDEVHAQAQASVIDAEARHTAVALREKAVEAAEQRVEHVNAALDEKATALALRLQGVVDAEIVALAVKTEYERKLQALSAIVAPQA